MGGALPGGKRSHNLRTPIRLLISLSMLWATPGYYNKGSSNIQTEGAQSLLEFS